MGVLADAWPPLTVVSGPAGAGKTRRVAAAIEPHRTAWLTLRATRHATELASRLVRHLQTRVSGLSPDLSVAVGPSCGPVSDADPLGRAEQLGSIVADELDATLERDLVLVVDELERLDGSPAPIRFVEALVRGAPDRLRLVLVTRTGVPFSIARLAADQRVERVESADLLLGGDDARALVVARWPGGRSPASSVVDALVDRARGNAGALLAATALVGRLGPDNGIEVLSQLATGPELLVAGVDRLVADLDRSTRSVLDDLVVSGELAVDDLTRHGHPEVDRSLDELIASQLADRRPDDGRRVRATRAAVEVVGAGEVPNELVTTAVRAAIERGTPSRALEAALAFGDEALVVDVLDRFGASVIEDGESQLVLDAIDGLPDGESARLAGLAGNAHMALGAWRAAIDAYGVQSDADRLAGHAWRHGLIQYIQGNAAIARSILDAGLRDERADDDPGDCAMLAGYAASVAWLGGDVEAARALAARALTSATVSGRDAAIAVAHTAAALVAASDGDRVGNDSHYVRALQHAERSGDALQVARIRSNRGSRLLEEGEFEAALAELDQAVRYANLGGFGTVLALALSNRGEVLTKLGRLDDARTDLATAVDILQRQGSRMVAYPLVGLARLFVVRGDVEQARSSAERALSASADAEDQQIDVAANLQLARALAERDPEAADRHARAATDATDKSLDIAEAWTVAATLALRRGDVAAAEESAARAASIARARRDRFALANAIEVEGLIEQGDARRTRLDEAQTLFRELGCVLDVARIDLHLAELDPPEQAATRVTVVADQARRLGARPLAAAASALLSRSSESQAGRVVVLGSFAIIQADGSPLPTSAWQSKKARDLLKMLITRRGRPLTRDQIIERLWPDDDPTKTANKLSVALTTVRSVLDPERAQPSDQFIQSDGDSIRLEPGGLDVDVERFLTVAERALQQDREAPGPAATALLAAAEAMYTGDVLEDDPYSDWHVPLREEARATYLAVARALATRSVDAGDRHDAIRLLLRLIEREPYDEPAHLDLIVELSATGRHGDARRRYQQYAERMRELDLEPQPFPTP